MSRAPPADTPLARPRQIWRLVTPGTAWRRFDDGVAVYDPLSGDTHLITRHQHRVVERLAAGPASVATLLHDEPEPANARACLHASLEALYALDLIEPTGE